MEKNKKGLRAIIAVNKLGFIGLNGGMPWRCSEDLKHFQTMTGIGTFLMVGRVTAENLPPLKDRNLLVVGSNELSLEQAMKMQPDWLIGGKKLYESALHLCTELHISIINDYTEGDVMCPDLRGFKGEIFVYEFEPNVKKVA